MILKNVSITHGHVHIEIEKADGSRETLHVPLAQLAAWDATTFVEWVTGHASPVKAVPSWLTALIGTTL